MNLTQHPDEVVATSGEHIGNTQTPRFDFASAIKIIINATVTIIFKVTIFTFLF